MWLRLQRCDRFMGQLTESRKQIQLSALLLVPVIFPSRAENTRDFRVPWPILPFHRLFCRGKSPPEGRAGPAPVSLLVYCPKFTMMKR